ncbi:MAG TPA: DUF4359 domain-containing protein [Nitrospira sp.]|nr:DUF4359 domain-containing protein [Nitrospira sp.]
MKIWHLMLLVAVLGIGVLLAGTNPSTDMYLAFLEAELGKALDRHQPAEQSRERDMVRTIFRAHSHELVVSIVRPHTIRHNWGFFSVFETSALDAHIEVLGIGTRFIPIKGVDDAIARFGRLAF